VRLEGLEETLSQLASHGTPVKLRSYRQVWRFSHDNTPLYIKLYPRKGTTAKRTLRGNPALREYNNLLALQKANISAPHAVAFLSGFHANLPHCQLADAVITRALEPSIPLEDLLRQSRLTRTPIPNRRKLAQDIISLVSSLTRANLGHNDLHLGNLLLSPPTPEGRLYLLDAYAVHPGPMTPFDLEVLGFAVSSVATRTEYLRAQRALTQGPALSVRTGKVARRHWRKTVERACSETDYAGKASIDNWTGHYFKRWKSPLPYASASALTVTEDDWRRELPRLLDQLTGELLRPLKRSASSDVWQGEIILAGKPVEVVVKRPYRRYWYRYLTELPRGTRAWRAWWKAWSLIARGIPTAWPLATFEQCTAGIATDQLLICQHIPGPQLDGLDLSSLTPSSRENLFRHLGRLLRRIDDTGIVHFDTKASNFMIAPDLTSTLTPILVDVDGVRPYSWRGEGLRRLLESLQDHHRQFTDLDAHHLQAGYNPFRRSP
jgi:tRNA A-37 threonylcarbamoyl transferase component Bud32